MGDLSDSAAFAARGWVSVAAAGRRWRGYREVVVSHGTTTIRAASRESSMRHRSTPMIGLNERRPRRVHRVGGFTLLELVLVVVILGIIGWVVLPRFSVSAVDSRTNACHANKANIEIQAALWYRAEGVWPNADLSDVGADPAYFPDGLPTCPVDGTGYLLDAATGRVIGHDHPSS